MWPQLLELLPHIARLLPHADRFFQSKAANDEANRRSFEKMTEALRADLRQASASHAGLYRQLNDQSEKISALVDDLHATRASLQGSELRLAKMQSSLDSTRRMLTGSLVLMLILIALVVFRTFGH
jgi:septal ring factor EnvC (AmiA/AmiB activator)